MGWNIGPESKSHIAEGVGGGGLWPGLHVKSSLPSKFTYYLQELVSLGKG